MKTHPFIFTYHVIAVAALVLALPGLSFCQSARQQVEEEIVQISKGVEANNSSDDQWKQLKPYLKGSLAKARQAVEADHLFIALEYLESARTNWMAFESFESNATNSRDMDSFESEWKRADAELKPAEQRYLKADWSFTPLAVRAMAEASWSRTRTYYDSSRAMAQATEPKYGPYYLGIAKASIDYANFCRGLRFTENSPASALRTMAPEIRQLEIKITEAYQPPRSVEQHSQFIKINSALKEANDLDTARLYAGTLYKYLDSLEGYAALEAAVPDPEPASQIRQRLSEARQHLMTMKADHSIAELFLQRAEDGLEPGEAKENLKTGMKNAQAILDQVIPAYFAALEKSEQTPSPPAKAITMTLVRWPYT